MRFKLPDQPSFYCGAPLTTAWSFMACLVFASVCWVVQEKLAAGSYEEGWSRIDGEEQAMVADGGSRIERSGRRFGRLQEEANRSLVSFWVVLKRGARGGFWGQQVRMWVTVVSEVWGMDRELLGEKSGSLILVKRIILRKMISWSLEIWEAKEAILVDIAMRSSVS